MTRAPLSWMQENMIDFALERKGSAWFVPPGMGKTRAWLNVIDATKGRTLVIAPKLVCMNTWPRELEKWGYRERFSMRFLHGRNRHLRNLPDVSLINYEAIPWFVEHARGEKKFPFESVIYDELSKLKSPESARYQSWGSVADRFRYRNGGTGTPVGAHLKDLFGEMYVCDLGRSLGHDHERFMRRYFHESKYDYSITPYSDAKDEILKRIYPNAISFDINDLDMPELSHHPIYLDMPEKARLYYEEMHNSSVVEDLELAAVNAAVRSGKLRQMASGAVLDHERERRYLHSAKSKVLMELIDEFQGAPIMVFFEFLSDYEEICRALKREVPALYGRTKAKDANKIVNDWNAGLIPVLALHPRSASYGLNLQDSGHVIVWFTIPWSYELVNQGTARLWRQGQKNKVMAYYLIVERTVDESVFARVNERKNLHDEVMEALL